MKPFDMEPTAHGSEPTDEGNPADRKTSMFGPALGGLLIGIALAAVALFLGWGWIITLALFWVGGSGGILVLALIGQRRPAPVVVKTEGTDKDLATI